MNIVSAEPLDFLPEECIKELHKFGTVTFNRKASDKADVLIVKRTHVNKALFDYFPNLKYIITLTIGMSHIDREYAQTRGLRIFNCPTYNHHAVVEHTFALLFAISRHITESNLLLKQNKWKSNPDAFQGIELNERTLVVLGNGHIGREVAERAKMFGMHVSSVDSKTPKKNVTKLLRGADFVSIHLPYSKATHHFFNTVRIGILKETVMLINTCKNEIIDEAALLKALRDKKIAGCALDVFENDPAQGNLSTTMKKIIALPNVVATPHIAFNTKEANVRLSQELLRHLHAISS